MIFLFNRTLRQEVFKCSPPPPPFLLFDPLLLKRNWSRCPGGGPCNSSTTVSGHPKENRPFLIIGTPLPHHCLPDGLVLRTPCTFPSLSRLPFQGGAVERLIYFSPECLNCQSFRDFSELGSFSPDPQAATYPDMGSIYATTDLASVGESFPRVVSLPFRDLSPFMKRDFPRRLSNINEES